MQQKKQKTYNIYIMSKKIFLSVVLLSFSVFAHSQSATDTTLASNRTATPFQFDWGTYGSLKMSGYAQFQWQLAGSNGIDALAQAGAFPLNSNNRFLIRRGRIKFEYSVSFATFVLQPDFTQKGVAMRDVYIRLQDRKKMWGGQFGVFDRPFGYEISYSSRLRESVERSRIFVSLFPDERDVGAMAMFKYGGWSIDAGIFNGNGIANETDSYKDFIGRVSYMQNYGNGHIGGEFSYYNGGISNPTTTHYVFEPGFGFQPTPNEQYAIHKRVYFGIGARFLQSWGGSNNSWTTNIRAEYIWGQQPGTFLLNYNQLGGYAVVAPEESNYLRKIRGGYAILVQQIANTKHSAVLKYDLYDPNIQVQGAEIGALENTGPADIAYSTLGVGYEFKWNRYVRLMAYYEFVKQETTPNIIGNYQFDYNKDIKDNVLTLRLQVMF